VKHKINEHLDDARSQIEVKNAGDLLKKERCIIAYT
jgi:hypothetical protein